MRPVAQYTGQVRIVTRGRLRVVVTPLLTALNSEKITGMLHANSANNRYKQKVRHLQ